MNISNQPPITFAGMFPNEAELHPTRMALYHSSGPGYAVFRQFIDPGQVAYMQRFWTGVDPAASHSLFPGKTHIYPGCPDYYVVDADGSRTFHNFFWNAPLDEFTHTLSIAISMLRNRISGRAPFAEVLPHGAKAVNYRVIVSKNTKTWIAAHRDYAAFDKRFEKNKYDPSRLQATLFLSKKGQDYTGTGFKFERNDGQLVSFGTDVPVDSGDLVIWRYNNLHSVEDIATEPGRLGFMRMIFPPEDVVAKPVAQSGAANGGLKQRVGSALRSLLRA
jgi:hypothetical protein